MKLQTRIMLAATGAVVVTTLLSIAIVYQVSSRNRVTELRTKMSSIISQSELMADNMDSMHQSQVFDVAGLMARAKQQAGGASLRTVYQATDLYKTIPIVAAWKSVEGVASNSSFAFLTPTAPGVPARNPKNASGSEFAAAFQAFAKGESEYFVQDGSKNELVLARPVRLQASCLECHGEPSRSTSGDGNDPLGFPMEGLKVGDVKGAFVLKANIGHDAVVMATMRIMALGGGVVLLLVLGATYFFNRRFIVRPMAIAIEQLDEASQQTAGAAAEISGGSHAVADGASEQAAALEQTSASLEEMSSMTSRNSESANRVTDLARQTRQAADRGVQDMRAMSTAMDGIKASSDEISKIIRTIDEIAFQTNILALNAAVEAARAGEAGMGFAVVADEVRALAQRSAEAAKETARKIEEALTRTGQGVGLSSKVSLTLQEIVEKARQVDDQVQQVAAASREQSQGIVQLNSAVSQMDRVTQANASSAEQSAAAAAELNMQADSMRTAVARLLELVSGSSHGAVSAAPARTPARAAHASAKPAFSAPRKSAAADSHQRGQSLPMPPAAPAKAPTSNGEARFRWDPETMRTGVESVDEEHQELIEMINNLDTACRQGEGKERLQEMVAFLADYVKRHFSREEAQMEALKCPSRAKNKAAHRQFLAEFAKFQERFEREGATTSMVLELKALTGSWLVNHICTIDTELLHCTQPA